MFNYSVHIILLRALCNVVNNSLVSCLALAKRIINSFPLSFSPTFSPFPLYIFTAGDAWHDFFLEEINANPKILLIEKEAALI